MMFKCLLFLKSHGFYIEFSIAYCCTSLESEYHKKISLENVNFCLVEKNEKGGMNETM